MSAVAGPSKPKTKLKKGKKAPVPVVAPVDSDSDSDSDSASTDSDDLDATPPTPVSRPRNNGSKPSSLPKYQAPPGMEEVKVSVGYGGPFEYDAMLKPGLELWAIRVPADFKPSRLTSLSVSAPTADEVHGQLTAKGASYALSSAGKGDGEAAGMRLLVPQKRGALMQAPIPITRHVLLEPREGAVSSTSWTAPPKPKREQPAHLLKFRNRAYGFDTAGPAATVVDDEKEDGDADVDEKMDEDEDEKHEADEKEEGYAASSPKKAKAKDTKSPKKARKDKESKESKESKSPKKDDKEKRKKRKSDAGESPAKKKRKAKE